MKYEFNSSVKMHAFNTFKRYLNQTNTIEENAENIKLSIELKPIKVSKSDINILLLGETGVGKSTFINSFANYVTNTSLEEIEKNKVICLIPTSFSVINKDFQSQTVILGCDRNEDLKLGNSSTQGGLSYKFVNKNIRFIDTPGIGDCNGIEKDHENYEKLFLYIKQFEHLHGIWILLRPDQKILNTYYKFCLFYLFSRLEKSVTSNICFVFTNSRATHYKPRDTLPLLESLLSEIKENPPFVEIPCSQNNMFCVDNEGFRYLVALNQGVQFDSDEQEDYRKSFKISKEACFRLINYVSGLSPHDIKKTSKVNEARKLIVELTKPLVKVTDEICNKKIILRRRESIITDKTISITELQKRLKRLKKDIDNNKLTTPVFVCTDPKCSQEYTSLEGVTKYKYKEECDVPWYLKALFLMDLENLGTSKFHASCKMTGGLVGSIGGGLVGGLASVFLGPVGALGTGEAASISASCGASAGAALGVLVGKTLNELLFQTCTKCQCQYSKHKRVYYDPDIVSFMKNEEALKEDMKSDKDTLKLQRQLIENLHVIIAEHENEKKIITMSLAKFAIFLEKNSIVLYNSSYIDYINLLIENEESLGANRDSEKVKRYKILKKEYEEEKNIFITNLSAKNEFATNTLHPEEILNTVKELLSLKHSGNLIKELQQYQEALRTSDPRHFLEYCVDLPQLCT